ncbi:MAG TPA: RIO1 family regulatory kinase/ATPase [Treponemataceae bacterium]|nr:RIO1 family regulatory kinase/ATPase [Treponemataceae bacterium]
MSTIDIESYEDTEDILRTASHNARTENRRRVMSHRGEDESGENADCFSFFKAEGIIAREGTLIKPGKEASVYRCPGIAPRYPEYVAVKRYKDVERRSFKALAQYLQGRLAESGMNRRDLMHLLSSPESILSFWVESEYATLMRLSERGLPVPRPYARWGAAIAMECVGGKEPAPRLQESELTEKEARAVTDEILHAIGLMLELDVVHGDLSPYNVLMREGKPVIIDFPQAIDARFNRNAKAYLARDIENILRYRDGVCRAGASSTREASAIADLLWKRYGNRGAFA